jgi:hypothetical protein
MRGFALEEARLSFPAVPDTEKAPVPKSKTGDRKTPGRFRLSLAWRVFRFASCR